MHQWCSGGRSADAGLDFYGRPTEAIWFHIPPIQRGRVVACLLLGTICHFATQTCRFVYSTYDASNEMPGTLPTNATFAFAIIWAVVGGNLQGCAEAELIKAHPDRYPPSIQDTAKEMFGKWKRGEISMCQPRTAVREGMAVKTAQQKAWWVQAAMQHVWDGGVSQSERSGSDKGSIKGKSPQPKGSSTTASSTLSNAMSESSASREPAMSTDGAAAMTAPIGPPPALGGGILGGLGGGAGLATIESSRRDPSSLSLCGSDVSRRETRTATTAATAAPGCGASVDAGLSVVGTVVAAPAANGDEGAEGDGSADLKGGRALPAAPVYVVKRASLPTGAAVKPPPRVSATPRLVGGAQLPASPVAAGSSATVVATARVSRTPALQELEEAAAARAAAEAPPPLASAPTLDALVEVADDNDDAPTAVATARPAGAQLASSSGGTQKRLRLQAQDVRCAAVSDDKRGSCQPERGTSTSDSSSKSLLGSLMARSSSLAQGGGAKGSGRLNANARPSSLARPGGAACSVQALGVLPLSHSGSKEDAGSDPGASVKSCKSVSGAI